MRPINMIKIYSNYKGKWVALESATKIKVVASGKNLKEVLGKAEQKGFRMPLMIQVPKEILPIVGPYAIK